MTRKLFGSLQKAYYIHCGKCWYADITSVFSGIEEPYTAPTQASTDCIIQN